MNEVCDSAITAEGVSASSSEARAIPLVVYCLTLGVFALTTSELMISGMMPALQEAFGRSISDIGNLISVYALGMTIGGPLVTILFLALKIENKRGLLLLLILYAVGQSVAASTSNFRLAGKLLGDCGAGAVLCVGDCAQNRSKAKSCGSKSALRAQRNAQATVMGSLCNQCPGDRCLLLGL